MKVKIQQGKEEINSIGGISLIGGLLNSLKNLIKADNMRMKNVKTGKNKHSGILKSMIGLFALGKTDYADVEPFRNDAFFSDSLNLNRVPSESTLRQRCDEFGQVQEMSNIALASNIELLKQVSNFGVEKTAHSEYIPFDADVSPQDNSGSHKEGVSWTYKGHDGYAPMLAYLGTHGYMLNCEQRPGSQHSNKGAFEFFNECFDAIDKLGLSNTLFRLDSAHDDANIIEECQKRKKHFLIKRNLRKESREQWLALARRVGTCENPREGKNKYVGVASHMKPAGRDDLGPIFAVFEVIERTIKADGQELLLPEIEVNTWWTNLSEAPETVIRLYHNHGTSEQFHSELKSDLGLERMPSGKFATNSLLLLLGMLAFNILRIIGQSGLLLKKFLPRKFNVQRRRLRSVMQDLIYIACKRTRHSGSIFLKFGRHCPWFEVFRQLHTRFC